MSPYKPLALLYDSGWGRTMGLQKDCPPGFEVTTDRSRIAEARAVVFHIPTAPDLRRIRKLPGQKWVAWSMESDVNYPQLRDPRYMAQFDLTMSYRWDSDVPSPYFGRSMPASVVRAPVEKTAGAPAVYFASNTFDKWGRWHYVRELMRHLPVDSYGRSLRNRILPKDDGTETKLKTVARYRFTIAFENSISRDYVTEKFFEPLTAGSVPVYLGAPNIDEFAPGDLCCIDAAQFHGPRELAAYLDWLAHDEAQYGDFLAWKNKPLRESFLEKARFLENSLATRLCARLLR